MIFTIFVTSLVGLSLFFVIKIWEVNTKRKFLSINTLDKSDVFLNKSIAHSQFYFSAFLLQLNKVPVFLDIFLANIIGKIKSLKDLFILKIVDFLNFDNIKNIEKNKGSVSLFLKKISDSKEEK